jgi:L-asparaginase / beta-aspartyl-peptidase
MTSPVDIVLAVHGGAGAISKDVISDERERDCHAALAAALRLGYAVLAKGGSSLDAVVASVCSLEDCPLFNAGRGSVLTYDARVRMDAAVMEGKDRRAGAVTNIHGVRNPVWLAREVMNSAHVFLTAEGAVEFARSVNAVFESDEYFITPERLLEWQETSASLAKTSVPAAVGTVGAVALDRDGTLAAATSTGGMVLKRWSRVGDSPVIGAGTYADNRSCAVSATGYGEIFLRAVAAHEVSSRVRHLRQDLESAVDVVLLDVQRLGGEGGMIAIDPTGNVAMRFNSEGMYRGYITGKGHLETKIW